MTSDTCSRFITEFAMAAENTALTGTFSFMWFGHVWNGASSWMWQTKLWSWEEVNKCSDMIRGHFMYRFIYIEKWGNIWVSLLFTLEIVSIFSYRSIMNHWDTIFVFINYSLRIIATGNALEDFVVKWEGLTLDSLAYFAH
jgi:hypothetical protein